MIPRRVVRDLERQLAREPGNLTVRVTLAAAYRELGRTAEAVEQYRLVAAGHLRDGRTDEASAACASGLALAPADDNLRLLAEQAQAEDLARAVAPVSRVLPTKRAGDTGAGASMNDLETPLPPPMALHDSADSLIGMPVGLTTAEETAERLAPAERGPALPRPLPPVGEGLTSRPLPSVGEGAAPLPPPPLPPRGLPPLPRLGAPTAPQRPGLMPSRAGRLTDRATRRLVPEVGDDQVTDRAVRAIDPAIDPAIEHLGRGIDAALDEEERAFDAGVTIDDLDELDVASPIVALTEVRKAGEAPFSPDATGELATRKHPRLNAHDLGLLELDIFTARPEPARAAPVAAPRVSAAYEAIETLPSEVAIEELDANDGVTHDAATARDDGAARAVGGATLELPDTALETPALVDVEASPVAAAEGAGASASGSEPGAASGSAPGSASASGSAPGAASVSGSEPVTGSVTEAAAVSVSRSGSGSEPVSGSASGTEAVSGSAAEPVAPEPVLEPVVASAPDADASTAATSEPVAGSGPVAAAEPSTAAQPAAVASAGARDGGEAAATGGDAGEPPTSASLSLELPLPVTDFDDEPTQPPAPDAEPPERLHAALLRRTIARDPDGEPSTADRGTFASGFTGTLAELAPDGSALDGPLGVFSMLPPDAANDLARRAVVKLYDDGEVVVREGDVGDSCFVIVRGGVVVTRAGAAGEPPVELARLGEGALFGEFAILADRRRHATVTALGDAEIYVIPRLLLRELAAIYPDVGPALERFYRERLLSNLIHTSPLFARLAVDERAGLLAAFEPMRVESGHAIVRQGERAGGLYLIVLGAVEVVCRTDDRRAVVLATLGEGAYVGEISLLTGEVATASVVACGPVELAALSPTAFYRVVSDYPELWAAMRDEAQERRLRTGRVLAGRTAVV